MATKLGPNGDIIWFTVDPVPFLSISNVQVTLPTGLFYGRKSDQKILFSRKDNDPTGQAIETTTLVTDRRGFSKMKLQVYVPDGESYKWVDLKVVLPPKVDGLRNFSLKMDLSSLSHDSWKCYFEKHPTPFDHPLANLLTVIQFIGEEEGLKIEENQMRQLLLILGIHKDVPLEMLSIQDTEKLTLLTDDELKTLYEELAFKDFQSWLDYFNGSPTEDFKERYQSKIKYDWIADLLAVRGSTPLIVDEERLMGFTTTLYGILKEKLDPFLTQMKKDNIDSLETLVEAWSVS